jgi:N-acetylmuramoyl-L-alanine amidase
MDACPSQKFAELAKGAPTASLAPVATAASPSPAGLPVIVLDPGHGGADGGAHGPSSTISRRK